jgi:hypothetical protein
MSKPFARPLALLLLAASLAAPGAASAQTVPGHQVSNYATVTHPVMLSFGPDGVLYAGRDPTPSGSTTAVHVSSIGVGGTPVASLGNVPISDPDTILLDTAGTISGLPGTLLVTGLLGATGPGRISGIRPDGSVFTIFDAGPWENIVEMKFDLTGRLVFTALESRSIWTSTGGTPTILATLPGSAYPTFLTIGADNRIVVAGSDNVIRIYNANGTLANGSLATLGGFAGLEYGQGGAFGSDLYAVDTVAGTLVRVSAAGVKTTIGTGFPTGFGTKDIAVGPSGDLYVSLISADKVVRVGSPWSSLGSALAGVSGKPAFAGAGTLAAGSSNTIDLSNAKPSAVAGLFFGLSSGSIPFKGGILEPAPFFGPVMLGTSPAGTIGIPFLMPAGVPAGTTLVLQWAIQDAAAVQGVSLSNAVQGLTP